MYNDIIPYLPSKINIGSDRKCYFFCAHESAETGHTKKNDRRHSGQKKETNMDNKDTVYLLKECDAGTKMAISSIDEVIDRIGDSAMKQLLNESKSHHEKLEAEIHDQLAQHQSEEKDPTPIAKSMSWMKTNMKMTMDDSDATVADLITDGCNMGIKTLHRYLNQYKAADETSKDICTRLVSIEENLCRELRSYL